MMRLTTVLGIFISNLSFAQITNKHFSVSEKPILVSTKIPCSYIKESPNGNYLYYASQDLNDVYIKNLKKKSNKDLLAFKGVNSGYFASWSDDSKKLYMRNKVKINNVRSLQTIELNLASLKSTERKDIITESIIGNTISESFFNHQVYINSKLQLVKSNQKKQEVLLEKEKQCYQPLVSPNQKMVAVHIGPDIWIYDIDGETKPYKLGQGLASCWSSDSKYVIGHIDTSVDGHELSGSELYLFDITTTETIQLTATPAIYEINPMVSSDGTKLYFVDAKTNKAFYYVIKK